MNIFNTKFHAFYKIHVGENVCVSSLVNSTSSRALTAHPTPFSQCSMNCSGFNTYPSKKKKIGGVN